jgi:hypothetical protein
MPRLPVKESHRGAAKHQERPDIAGFDGQLDQQSLHWLLFDG